MNALLLNRNIFIYLFVESLSTLVMFLTFAVVLKLLFQWHFETFTPLQYRLEKYAYLVMTVITAVFSVKFLLLPYFIFSIDAISNVVPGAMCAAGVISFNEYGMMLLYLKITILLFLVLWLVINHYDLKAGHYPWFKIKYLLFIPIFFMFCWELFLDFTFFKSIDIHTVLNCCSTLYGLMEGMNPLPFGLNIPLLIALFYLLWMLLVALLAARWHLLYFIVLIFFGMIAYYSVLYFFGTYIYEQPEHNCPFCMLQNDYYYVGYTLWGMLLGGLFSGISAGIVQKILKVNTDMLYRTSLLLITLFLLLCTAYVGVYYYSNGTLLQQSSGEIQMSMPM
jgi:hypothetical protein